MDIQFPSGLNTYICDAAPYAGQILRFSGATVYDVNYCGTSALYYRNSQSGYDCFLIEGRSERTDKYNQVDIYKAYNNTTMEFGHSKFMTDITVGWKLTTGWLTDEQSEVFVTNLMPSPEVYFHNLEDNTIHPCVITDTSVKHKTYDNEGHQLVAYDINIEYSQNTVRK